MRPVQVRVFVGARRQPLPVGGHDLGTDEIVAAQAVAAHEPPESAAERQAADAGTGDRAARRDEAFCRRRRIERRPARTALGEPPAAPGVYADGLHRPQVDHDRAVAHGLAGDVVPAAAHRHRQPVFPREVDHRQHVPDAPAARNRRGTAVDHAIPDLAPLVIAGVGRKYEPGA
jgi:hypothetical protein